MIKIFKSILATLLIVSVANGSADVKTIDLKKAKSLHDAGSYLFLDARPMKLYKKGTIMGAMHFHVKKYKKLKRFLPPVDSKKTKIVTFCNGPKCHLAPKLAKKLMKDGYKKVYVYSGGYPEWKEQKQISMGLLKKCNVKKGPYKPKKPLITIAGAKVHLGKEDSQIDQMWFSPLLNKGKIPQNITLVDVRKPEQFKESHLSGAISAPVIDEKTSAIDISKLPKEGLIILYCNTGMQSMEARGSIEGELAKRVVYLDANLKCKDGSCKVEPNEDVD